MLGTRTKTVTCGGSPCPNGIFKENAGVRALRENNDDGNFLYFEMTWCSAFCGWWKRLMRLFCCMFNVGVRYTIIVYLSLVFFLLVCVMTQSWAYFMTTLAWAGLKHNAFFLMDTVVTAILGLVQGSGFGSTQSERDMHLDKKLDEYEKEALQRKQEHHRDSAVFKPFWQNWLQNPVEVVEDYRQNLGDRVANFEREYVSERFPGSNRGQRNQPSLFVSQIIEEEASDRERGSIQIDRV